MGQLDDRANKKPKSPMPQSWQRVVDLMPENDWSLSRAAIATGAFKQSYIEKQLPAKLNRDPRFTQAIAQLKAKIQQEGDFDPARIKKEYAIQYNKADNAGDVGNARGVLDSLARINGMNIDKSLVITQDIPPFKPGEREVLSGLAKQYLESQFAETSIIEAEIEEIDEREENEV